MRRVGRGQYTQRRSPPRSRRPEWYRRRGRRGRSPSARSRRRRGSGPPEPPRRDAPRRHRPRRPCDSRRRWPRSSP
ncbi:MAG: hypothetical protein DRJ42_01340 [Deltaproteobacteria bacterium]|nr:MAG: hypothetical protein DRJ42_01340 [Deltaproteobacteria bacterium]